MQVVVDDLMTSYEKIGKGPTVLLLHGWGDTHASFKALSKELASRYTVIAPDLPGFGGTQAPYHAWGVDQYCDFVARFLAKINQRNVFAIVGHSNGGTIAVRGLASGHLSAQKLVLLASAGVRDVYKGRKKALRIAAKAARAATAPLPKPLQTKLKKKAYKFIGSDMFVAEHLQETFKRVVTDDVQAEARMIKLPSLILYGANDTATPPSYGKLFSQAITGSELHIVEGAGHFVHHDQPQQVTSFVKEFLS